VGCLTFLLSLFNGVQPLGSRDVVTPTVTSWRWDSPWLDLRQALSVIGFIATATLQVAFSHKPARFASTPVLTIWAVDSHERQHAQIKRLKFTNHFISWSSGPVLLPALQSQTVI
jgi:hypothetical protein